MPNRFKITDVIQRKVFERTCPMCGHVQMVPLNRLWQALVCERCDYHIPERKAAA